jgi:hypothetical protein
MKVGACISLSFEAAVVNETRRALAKGDEHLNSITLRRWDMLAQLCKPALQRALKKHGCFWSMSSGVLAMKRAAADAAIKTTSKDNRKVQR